ncbi:MAG TPA: hypothetical protein VHK90_10220, partial [Thermoanaerobaculia bacterium]|nr:hypothetical protein [Thermoanaerobaculia bacterium]
APDAMTRRQRALLLVFAAVAAMTRFVALSKGPWDWDEVLFCLAIRDYDVSAHWPHPPGFPLYIAMGKIARLFAPSDFTALQTVNVLAGMAVLPVMYWLARSLRFGFAPALTAATIFAFLPNVWFFGGTAFSDVPAMVLFLAAIAAYCSAGTNARRYALASVLFGAALLFRPQNALVAVFPWTIATVRFARARQWRPIIAGSLIVAAIVLLGYGTAAWLSGFESYIDAVRGHSIYVRNADTAANPTRPSLLEVLRIQLDPYHAGKVSILVNVLALIGILRGPRGSVVEILLTYLPFYLFAALVVNPLGSSRFSLNYIAGIVLLATLGMYVIADLLPRARYAIAIALTAVIAGRFVYWVLPAFENPRSTHAPPTQAAMWVAQNVPKSKPVFMDESIWPWSLYYITGHELVHVHRHEEIVRHPRARDGWYLHMEASLLDDARVFVRPRDRIWNIVTQRAFEASVIPSSRMAAFTGGWHGQETDGTWRWRWSQRQARMEFPSFGGTGALTLLLSVPQVEQKKSVRVSFFWNGRHVSTLTTRERDNEIELRLPSREAGANVLDIHCHDWFVPRQLAGGHDERELGIQLWSWQWRRL